MDAPTGAQAPAPAGDAEVAALQREITKLKAENKKLTQENAVLRKQVLTLLDRDRPGASGDEPHGLAATPDNVDDDPPF